MSEKKNSENRVVWEMVFNKKELKECDSLLQETNRK